MIVGRRVLLRRIAIALPMLLMALAASSCAGRPATRSVDSGEHSKLEAAFRERYVARSAGQLSWDQGPDEYLSPRYGADGRGIYLYALRWAPNGEDAESRLYHVTNAGDRNPRLVDALPDDLPSEFMRDLNGVEPAIPDASIGPMSPDGTRRIESVESVGDGVSSSDQVRLWVVDVRTGAKGLLHTIAGSRGGVSVAWPDNRIVAVAARKANGPVVQTLEVRTRSVIASVALDGGSVDRLVAGRPGTALVSVSDLDESASATLYEYALESGDLRRVGEVGKKGDWDYCATRRTIVSLTQPFHLGEFTLP